MGDEVEEARLWNALEAISNKLSNVEQQMTEVIRVQERVNTHTHTLKRYGILIDDHEKRIRETELEHAKCNSPKEIDTLFEKVNLLESAEDTSAGRLEISREIFKWVAGLGAAYLLFRLKKGA